MNHKRNADGARIDLIEALKVKPMKHIDPMKLPKTLRPLAARIADFEDDRRNQNGYWVHLANGWFSDITETHTIHEDTLSHCRFLVRDARPCTCEDCTKAAR